MKTYIKRILSLVLVAVMLSVWTPFTPAVDNVMGSVYAYAEGEGAEGEDPAGEDPAGEDPAGEDPAGEDPAGEDPADEGEVPTPYVVDPITVWTYDGAAIEDGAELTLVDFDISKLKVSIDGAEKNIVSFDFGSEKDVEWSMDKISARGLGSYVLKTEDDAVDPIEIKFVAAKLSLNGIEADLGSHVYNYNEGESYSLTGSGAKDGYIVDFKVAYPTRTNVGTYSISLDSDDVTSITKGGVDVKDLVNTNGTANGTLVITKYEINYREVGGGLVVDGKIKDIVVYKGAPYETRLYFIGDKSVLFDCTITDADDNIVDKVENAGEYSLQFTGLSNENYDASSIINKTSKPVSVNRNEVSPTWKYKEVTMVNGNKMEVPTGFSFEDPNGNEIVVDGTDIISCDKNISDPIDAGVEYIFTIDKDAFEAAYPNYTISGDLTNTVSGNAKSVEVFYDDEFIYDGKDVGVNAYYIDNGGNQKSAVVTLPEGGIKNAGEYTVSFSIEDANYVASNTTGTVTVNPLEIKLAADNQTITYGEEVVCTYDVTEGATDTISEEDIIAELGDAVFVYNGGTEVGTYEGYIVLNSDFNNGNFTITEATSGDVTIEKLAVTVTPVADQKKVYGHDDPAISYTVTLPDGYAAKDEAAVKDELGAVIVREEGETVGTYSYELASEINDNYTVTLSNTDNEQFEIVKAAIVVTPDMNQGKYYGEADEVITYSFEVKDGANEYSEEELAAIRTELGDIVVRVEGEDEGSYSYSPTAYETDNLTIVFNNIDEAGEPIEYRIYRLPVTISGDAVEKFYGGDDPALTYTVTSVYEDILTADEVAAELGEALLTRDAENENVGTYATYIKSGEGVDQFDDNMYDIGNFEVTFTEGSLTIKKLPVVVTPDAGQAKFYGADDVTPYTFAIDWDEEVTNLNEDIIRRELTGIGGDMGNMDAPTEGDIVDIVSGDVLKREDGENVGFYNYSLVTTDYANYDVTLDTNEDAIQYEIKKLPITVVPLADQGKNYAGTDPDDYVYNVIIAEGTDTNLVEADIIGEMGLDILDRVYGEGTYENAGEYDIVKNEEVIAEMCGNYDITLAPEVFTIYPLAVIVTPDAGQSKIYGEVDPEYYEYSVNYEVESNITFEEIKAELTEAIVIREEGEDIGTYDYLLNSEVDSSNYALVFGEETDAFEITAHEITVDEIDSRTDILTVSMAGGETFEYKEGVNLYLKIEAELATSETVICVTDELSDFFAYETANEDGSVIVNLGNVGAVLTTDINTVDYDAIAKSGEALVLTGNLPAGTKLTITPVDSAYNAVGAPVELVVGVKAPAPTFVEFEYDHNHVSDASNSLTITGLPGEWVDVVFTAGEEAPTEGENAATYTEYAKHYQLGDDGIYEIASADLVVYDGASVHYLQVATVSYVDTLNLAADADSREFIYDTQAFAIPSSNILFANRDTVVNVTLPEVGVITSLEIPGATVVEYPSSASTTHAVTVTWSGMALITSGSEIKVNYTDLGGNANSGIGTVTQSAVTTPLNVKIRPKTNSAGYLGGDKADTLIISGTGCSCEPITVTVSDMDNVIYITQAEVWTDTEGTFQMSIDMSRLPDGETFNITVEYLDVVGTSAYVTVTYDAECLPAVLAMNSYENMAYLAGFAEPNVAVAFSLNGGALIELEVDRHGRFVMPQVPMMFGGIDTFTIYITDIAGNQWNYTYIVPEVITVDENGNAIPFYLEVPVAPLGAYFYGICDETGEPFYHALTPVDVAELTETGTMELPVLVGTVYEIGKFSVTRTETGIVVNSEITNEQLLADGYEVLSEKLYVFAEKPTAKDVHELEKSIEDGKAVAYTYGEEIAVEADAEIWIMSESEIKILEESTRNFVAYDLESDENYNKFQDAR